MYNANYMEGVPVKIAEKYKPPPQIYKLPQSLVNKLNLADDHYETSPQYQYDMQLERKALSKISEWKSIRQRNKYARKERKELREVQRKKDDEQKQRNLLCSVSYPNADDLSSTESEGDVGETDLKMNAHSKISAVEAECMSPQVARETPNSFHNILQPTVLSNYSRANTSAAANSNSISNNIQDVAKTSMVKNSSVSVFNYRDFEDDTSSPFDNIELKTINDLDVLAQVLHNTQIKTSSANAAELTEEMSQEKLVSATTTITTSLENANETEETETSPRLNQEIIPKHNNLPKFSYDLGNLNNAQEAQHKLNSYTAGQVFTNANFSPSLSPQTYMAAHQLHMPYQYQQGVFNVNNSEYYNNVHVMQMNKNNHALFATQEAGAKSKSVPDILKELREEIRNSEMRRTRNCSHNLENQIENSALCTPVSTNDAAIEEPDIFSNLDEESRQIAEQICGMGFPKDRVARTVQLLGADNKKIIEHLIPLSELADLGFEESKISEALLRHENNKNKALDDLIS